MYIQTLIILCIVAHATDIRKYMLGWNKVKCHNYQTVNWRRKKGIKMEKNTNKKICNYLHTNSNTCIHCCKCNRQYYSVSCTLEIYTLCKNCWFSHPSASTFGMPLRHLPWRDQPCVFIAIFSVFLRRQARRHQVMVLHITLSREKSINDTSPVMFVLATVYRAPGHHTDFIKEFGDFLSELVPAPYKVLI